MNEIDVFQQISAEAMRREYLTRQVRYWQSDKLPMTFDQKLGAFVLAVELAVGAAGMIGTALQGATSHPVYLALCFFAVSITYYSVWLSNPNRFYQPEENEQENL